MANSKKITKQYGRLLYEVSHSAKNESELKKHLESLAGLLVKKGLANKVNDITSDFQEYASKKEGELTVEVTTSRKLTNQQSEKIDKTLEKILAKKIKLTLLVDQKILGGVKLQVGDRVFDGTLK
ncbi:MAG: ATP synthase F1 subunit delta, partial [Candidatus Gribaldobacteria bacterium]|nr:ATP synthase F1 subunit delta [Candidatus Gribaldobacteria bacterium]